jgi:hypothetical protein
MEVRVVEGRVKVGAASNEQQGQQVSNAHQRPVKQDLGYPGNQADSQPASQPTMNVPVRNHASLGQRNTGHQITHQEVQSGASQNAGAAKLATPGTVRPL